MSTPVTTTTLPKAGELSPQGVLDKSGQLLPGADAVLPKEGNGGVLPHTGEGASPDSGTLPTGTSNVLPKASGPKPLPKPPALKPAAPAAKP
jgi:hypothetical protein